MIVRTEVLTFVLAVIRCQLESRILPTIFETSRIRSREFITKAYSEGMTIPTAGITKSSIYHDARENFYCCDIGFSSEEPLSMCSYCSELLCMQCSRVCSDCTQIVCENCLLYGDRGPISCRVAAANIAKIDQELTEPFTFCALTSRLTTVESKYFKIIRNFIVGRFTSSAGTWIFRPPMNLKDIENRTLYMRSYRSLQLTRLVEPNSQEYFSVFCWIGPPTDALKAHMKSLSMIVLKCPRMWVAFVAPSDPSVIKHIRIENPVL